MSGRSEVFRIDFPGRVDALSCTMKNRTDVALILWNEDVIDLVSLVLLGRDLISHGFEPSEGLDRMENLIALGSPRVVVFDLKPPYARSSEVALQLMARFPNMSFVITCADRTLALKSAPWLSSHRLFQKPYDIDEIASTVSLMARRDRIRFAALSVTAS